LKPAKPRVTKPRLNWKWNARRETWDPYHRVVWRDGEKQKSREIKLDWGGDFKKLDELYWKAQGGKLDQQARPQNYTWRECIEAWRSDLTHGAGKVAASTAKSYRAPMDRIMEKNGSMDMRKTERKMVKAALTQMQDTPRKASRFGQTISLLWNYALRELDWPLGRNPAAGFGKHKPSKQYKPWPKWMVAALSDAPERVRVAASLIIGTGQRPGAAIAMRWDQFQGEWMTVVDDKADEELEVYCPQSLQAALEAFERNGEHVLSKNLREPLGYNSVEKTFRAWRGSLGRRASPYVLHGLRKLAIVELAEAGTSDAEIQAVTGQSAEMVAYYRKDASRKKLSRTPQERRG